MSENKAVFNVHIRGTIDAVWHEITKTDSQQQCFFNMKMCTPGLEVGAPIRMRNANEKYTGVVGEVLEFDPPNKYAHTFKFTQFDDPVCTVIYELKESDEGGVDFTLTIDNLPAGTKTAKQMTQGGTMIVNTLKAIVETGQPSFGTRMLFILFKLMTPLTPKACLSENWPFEKKIV